MARLPSAYQEDVFYTNSGTGTFTKGNNIYTFPDFRAVKNFYIGNTEVKKIETEINSQLITLWEKPEQ